MDWYKTAQEFVGGDYAITEETLIDQQQIKQFPTGSPQGLGSDISNPLNNVVLSEHGKRASKCGEERDFRKPCCKADFSDPENVKWYGYEIDGYEAYECQCCHHKHRPFNIEISRTKTIKRRFKNRHSHLTVRRTVTATAPGVAYPGTSYNNPMNTPLGRTDYSEDARVMLWSEIADQFSAEYDSVGQKNNDETICVKVKTKGGKYKALKCKKGAKYIKYKNKKYKVVECEDGTYKLVKMTKKNTTGGDSGGLPNSYINKGNRSKQPRYNPSKGDNQKSPGAWSHNRNPGREGFYNQPDPGGAVDFDGRQSYTSWAEHTSGPYGVLLPY